MEKYDNLEFLLNKDTQKVVIEIPRDLLAVIDDYCIMQKISSRKKLLELHIIKYIIEIKKDLY